MTLSPIEAAELLLKRQGDPKVVHGLVSVSRLRARPAPAATHQQARGGRQRRNQAAHGVHAARVGEIDLRISFVSGLVSGSEPESEYHRSVTHERACG